MRKEIPFQQEELDAGSGGPAAPTGGRHIPHPVPPVLPLLELEVRYATHRIPIIREGREETDEVTLRSYNGQLVGPPIEARPGQTLRIRLRNNLPFVPALVEEHPHNRPHGFNVTNLHFHGMHVSPAGNADNVMLEIGPGRELEYEVHIPEDHHAGTFWYHPHKHGAVGIQLGSGMAGALIIRGDIDEVPAIKKARERIIVLQQIPYMRVDDPYHPGTQANMVEQFPQLTEVSWAALVAQGRRVTLNGEVLPTFTIQPGEVQRWRFIQAGLHNPFRLRVVKEGDAGAQRPRLYEIAYDGITTGRLDEVPETVLHPGYRVDVLVQAAGEHGAPLAEGTYLLVDEEEPHPQARILARVEVRADPRVRVSTALPSPAELAPLAPFAPIQDAELTGTFVPELGQGLRGMQQSIFEVRFVGFKDPNHIFDFLINGKDFDPHRDPPRQLTVGTAEEWLVASAGVASLKIPGAGEQTFRGHPFHIHVNPFQYTDKKGRIIWKDTLFVPRGESVLLRTRYKRYTGKFMLHCHIVGHEDDGMAEVVELVLPDPEQQPA